MTPKLKTKLIPLLAIILLSACATHKPSAIQTASTDTVVKVIIRVDSIRIRDHTSTSLFRHDSIAPIIGPKGDITGWDRFHSTSVTIDNSREILRLNSLIDSMRSVRADTIFIRQPPPETAAIQPATLSPWQQFRISAFWPLILALAASLIYIFRRQLLRLMCRLRL